MSQELWGNMDLGFAPAGKWFAARVGLVEVSKPVPWGGLCFRAAFLGKAGSKTLLDRAEKVKRENQWPRERDILVFSQIRYLIFWIETFWWCFGSPGCWWGCTAVYLSNSICIIHYIIKNSKETLLIICLTMKLGGYFSSYLFLRNGFSAEKLAC